MNYFPDFACCAYSANQFLRNIKETTKEKYKEYCLINFWVSNMVLSYPTPASHAVLQLLLFLSVWECEKVFSTMVTIKLKKRNRDVAPRHPVRCKQSDSSHRTTG